MREIGKTLETILEEREGEEDAKDSDSDKKEDLAKNLKSWEDGLFRQEAMEEMEAKEEEAGEDIKGITLIDSRNGFNEVSRLTMLWMVSHRWPSGAIFSLN